LGDDDTPRPGAVDAILELIAGAAESSVLSFTSDMTEYKDQITTTGRSGLCIAIAHAFGNLLFVSTNVYNATKLRKYIGFGYEYCHSNAPHLAMLLMSIEEHSTCQLLPQQIVDRGLPRPGDHWSMYWHLLTIGTLLDLPLKSPERMALQSAINNALFSYRGLLSQSILYALKSGDKEAALHIFGQIACRLLGAKPSLLARMKLAGLRLALENLWLTRPVAEVAFKKRTGRSLSDRSGEMAMAKTKL